MIHNEALLVIKKTLNDLLNICEIKDGIPLLDENFFELFNKFTSIVLKNKTLGPWLTFPSIYTIYATKLTRTISEATNDNTTSYPKTSIIR